MGTLSYLMISSADGFITSPDGSFDWAQPTPAIHGHANALSKSLVGEIYGSRLWDTMKVWADIAPGDGNDYGPMAAAMYEFGEQWRAMPHHVFSRRQGNPLTLAKLQELKAETDGELSIGGAVLAGVALGWGEVDEVSRYVVPYATGGGTPWWPTGVSAALELTEHEELEAGWLFTRYRVVR